ncbi:hypothetical protein BGW80DRAFT_1387216 [Lactifluus volemus]|nr:hypothetical protein BGW80DRAFT_1387216 [Lactifluus volemus]
MPAPMPHPLALDATVATPLDAWTQLHAIPIPFLSGLLLRAFRCLCQHVVPATSILIFFFTSYLNLIVFFQDQMIPIPGLVSCCA